MRHTYGMLFTLIVSAGLVQAEMMMPQAPMSDTELDALRGGFLMDNLEIAIGLEQIVSVNGEHLVINRLTIPNLNQVGNLGRFHSQMESLLAVQGAGFDGFEFNTSSVGAGGWMTVIQNSLNSTTIQNIRQLDIELNNLGGAYRVPRDTGLPLLLP